jgi:hypothetical protein
MLGRSIGLHG